jgi:hypothetical protein
MIYIHFNTVVQFSVWYTTKDCKQINYFSITVKLRWPKLIIFDENPKTMFHALSLYLALHAVPMPLQ